MRDAISVSGSRRKFTLADYEKAAHVGIVGGTGVDLLAEALALNGLHVLPCPFAIAPFPIKQHWHARYHHDLANQWLRATCVKLFQQRAMPNSLVDFAHPGFEST